MGVGWIKINQNGGEYMPILKLDDLDLLPVHRSDQHELSRLADSHQFFDLELREKKIRTTDVETQALQLADKAITVTKKLLPYGSPNQIVDVWLTNAENVRRRRERLMSPDGTTLEKIIRSGAGNCGEHSQVTFALIAGSPRNEPVSRVNAEGVDHAFVVIGDHRQTDRVTIADSWVTFPVAHLLRHGVFSINQVLDTTAPNTHSDPKYQIDSDWSLPIPQIQERRGAIDFFKQRLAKSNISPLYAQWTSLARLGGQYTTTDRKTLNFDRFTQPHILRYLEAKQQYDDLFENTDDESEEVSRYSNSRSPSLERRFARTTLL